MPKAAGTGVEAVVFVVQKDEAKLLAKTVPLSPFGFNE